ncbi:MAG: hypothetical protein DMF30_11495 [Verrucomicrobia bacterium]|nr:MAG: hypothetical protein DMF30_11495 [Verrucomicrobiota bacterium]
MMGAGKSSVGRCLERRTGRSRFDTDEMAAFKLGLSVREIFSKFGEEKFREVETQMLRELDPAKAMIIVTGGGIAEKESAVAANRKSACDICRTVADAHAPLCENRRYSDRYLVAEPGRRGRDDFEQDR